MRSLPACRYSAPLVLLALAACGPGQPWGELHASLTARFEPEPARLDSEGRLKTSKSYVLEIEELQVGIETMRVGMADGAAAGGFDPANPPAGYSLCHNGHCHSDDGRLVDYEDIQAELAAATGQTGFELVLSVADPQPLSLSSAVSVPLVGCEQGCPLPRGVLSKVGLTLSRLSLRARAFDLTPQGRLPAQGRPVRADFELQVPLEVRVERPVDRGSPVPVRLDLILDLPASVFDRLEFSELPETDLGLLGSVTTTVAENLSESEALSVTF